MQLTLASLERIFSAPLVDSVDRTLKEVKEGVGHARKFIVLVGKEKMYLVIGMKFVDEKGHPDFYMHKDLAKVAHHVLDKDGKGKYQLSGGGVITFSQRPPNSAWEAALGDSSSDFGVWDYRVLAHREEIATTLGMRTTFNWRGYTYPKTKT